MKPIPKEDVSAQLQWRYATKKFDPHRKIPSEEWAVLEKSLVLSPSSFGFEPWKFFIVINPEIRTQIRAVAWDQPQITDASYLVIFAAKRGINLSDVDALIERVAKTRNISIGLLEGYKSMASGFINNLSPSARDDWAARQVYIAVGQFLTTAAILGIDACPLEGFIPEKVDEILGIKNLGYGSVVLCAAGYRHAEDKYAELAKVRHKHEDIVVKI